MIDPATAILIAGLVLVALLLIEVPIGLAMAAAGIVGVILVSRLDIASSVLASAGYNNTAHYPLVVIPMYVLLGSFVANSGVGAQIYRAINAGVNKIRLPGGLPATAVIATSLFSGISGSSAADIAAFGRISVEEMERHGYRKQYAAAVVAAAGTFAVLIPPSIALVVYAILAGQSVGAMILAGVIPGAISAVFLTAFVIVRAALGSKGQSTGTSPAREAQVARATVPGTGPKATWRDALGIAYGAILFLIVVGGLYGGFFTATEAGAVGALAAFLITILASKSNRIPLGSSLWRSLRETVGTTSMIFLLVIGAGIVTYFIAVAGITASMTAWAVELPIAPAVVVAIVLVVIFAMGTIMEGLSVMLLAVPVAVPVITALGFDPIWFGVLCIKAMEIGLITPPLGLNVFIISGMTHQKAEKVFRVVVPFILLDVVVTVILFVFPELILWLPRAAGLLG